jgi:hypothetical protein
MSYIYTVQVVLYCITQASWRPKSVVVYHHSSASSVSISGSCKYRSQQASLALRISDTVVAAAMDTATMSLVAVGGEALQVWLVLYKCSIRSRRSRGSNSRTSTGNTDSSDKQLRFNTSTNSHNR